jgi:hypothetical protein
MFLIIKAKYDVVEPHYMEDSTLMNSRNVDEPHLRR